MPKFIVATEGATIDGREIAGKYIEQMAQNYDTAKYAARVWLEHIRGLYHDSSFAALGDVTALEVGQNKEGKKTLIANIEPLPELVKMNQAGQKLYTSIEIQPNFADTGEAYLVGLAVNDSPASTGTQRLQFNAQHQHQNYLITPYAEMTMPQENDQNQTPNQTAEPSAEPAEKHSLLDTVRQLFKSKTDLDELQNQLTAQLFKQQAQGTEQAIAEVIAHFNQEIADLKTAYTAEIAELKAQYRQIDQQPAIDYSDLPQATGGTTIQTDCKSFP